MRVLAGARPLVLIGATRQALRRAGVARTEIDDFSASAFAAAAVAALCRRWVRLVVIDPAAYPRRLRSRPAVSTQATM